MYAKLNNGVIKYAPNTVWWRGKPVTNPSEDKLLELGYLPVTYSDMPSDVVDGKHYESYWEQSETEIVQRWKLIDNPPPSYAQRERQSIVNLARMQTKAMLPTLENNAVLDLDGLVGEWDKGEFIIGDVRFYDNQTWKCCQQHDSTISDIVPGNSPAHWTAYHGTHRKHAKPFIQPTGAHDVYLKGEWCVFESDYYENIADSNAFSPADNPKGWILKY